MGLVTQEIYWKKYLWGEMKKEASGAQGAGSPEAGLTRWSREGRTEAGQEASEAAAQREAAQRGCWEVLRQVSQARGLHHVPSQARSSHGSAASATWWRLGPRAALGCSSLPASVLNCARNRAASSRMERLPQHLLKVIRWHFLV